MSVARILIVVFWCCLINPILAGDPEVPTAYTAWIYRRDPRNIVLSRTRPMRGQFIKNGEDITLRLDTGREVPIGPVFTKALAVFLLHSPALLRVDTLPDYDNVDLRGPYQPTGDFHVVLNGDGSISEITTRFYTQDEVRRRSSGVVDRFHIPEVTGAIDIRSVSPHLKTVSTNACDGTLTALSRKRSRSKNK